MTDQPESHPLSDADLLAWGVVLSYRDQQERDGIKILALPFPPCPTCGETVHKAVASWVREPFREEVTIDVHPCEHSHTATFADLERIHDHASEMLASLRLDDRLPGGKGRTTDDIVREARTRIGEPQETPHGPIDWARRQQAEREARETAPPAAAEPDGSELTAEEARALADDLGLQLYRAQDALAFVGECCDIADREQRTITTADVREWLKGARCGRQLVADAAAATQVVGDPTTTELLRRYRDWLAAQHARAARADQAGGVPDELKISPHNGIASGLHTALLGLDRILDAHDTGPSIRECAEADARWWNGEKAGE